MSSACSRHSVSLTIFVAANVFNLIIYRASDESIQSSGYVAHVLCIYYHDTISPSHLSNLQSLRRIRCDMDHEPADPNTPQRYVCQNPNGFVFLLVSTLIQTQSPPCHFSILSRRRSGTSSETNSVTTVTFSSRRFAGNAFSIRK